MKKLCARCRSEFECDPGPDCWCTRLPPAMPMTGAGCYCPRCLGDEIEARIAARRASETDVSSSES